MTDKAQELLMHLIADLYSGQGRITRGTSLKLMSYVFKAGDGELQKLVNIGDKKQIREFREDDR